MAEKYSPHNTIKGIITVIGLLSIPTLVVRDRIKKIKLEEQERKTIDKIVKNTIELENQLDNKKAKEYIEFVRNLKIPNKVVCKNIILNGYDIIKANKSVDKETKEKFARVLYIKGIKKQIII